MKKVQARAWWVDREKSGQKIAGGEVYVDGSYKGAHWRSARAAWAAIHIDKEGEWAWTYSGVLSERHVSSYRAELTAVLEVLRIAVGPTHVHCDNKEVVEGMARGEKACTASTADCADLWRKIWRIKKEIGDDFQIDWMPGHSTWIHVLEGKLSPHQHVGNDMADKAAKEARSWAEGTAPNVAYAVRARKARSWYRWVLDFVTSWPYEGGRARKEEEGQEQRAREQEGRPPPNNIRHEIWRVEGSLRCRRCAREFGKGGLQPGHAYETCKGTASGRALAALTGNVNHLWADFAIDAIKLLKQGAELVRATKVPEIAVDWSQLEEYMGTAEGRQALQRCIGEEAWNEVRMRERERQDRRKRGRQDGDASEEGTKEMGGQRERQSEGGDTEGRRLAAQQSQEGERQPNVRRRVTGKRPEGERAEDGTTTSAARGREGDEERQEGRTEGTGQGGAQETRRRLRGKQRPPQQETPQLLKVRRKDKEWARGHAIRKKGGVVFCVQCGSYAEKRFGAGLRAKCSQPKSMTSNAANVRLQRLQRGQHPLQQKDRS